LTALEVLRMLPVLQRLGNAYGFLFDIRPHRRYTRPVQSYSPGGTNVHSHQYMVPWTHLIQHRKMHLDRFSHFCTSHGRDRPPLFPWKLPLRVGDLNSHLMGHLPPEGDRINWSRRNLTSKRIPWVCSNALNLTLIVKRRSVQEPPNVKICPKLWFVAAGSQHNEHIQMKVVYAKHILDLAKLNNFYLRQGGYVIVIVCLSVCLSVC